MYKNINVSSGGPNFWGPSFWGHNFGGPSFWGPSFEGPSFWGAQFGGTQFWGPSYGGLALYIFVYVYIYIFIYLFVYIYTYRAMISGEFTISWYLTPDKIQYSTTLLLYTTPLSMNHLLIPQNAEHRFLENFISFDIWHLLYKSTTLLYYTLYTSPSHYS